MSSVRRRLFVPIGGLLIAAYPTGIAQQSVPTLRVSVSCSTVKPGTAAATILWRTRDAPISQSRLDVTVYQSGFSRGWYAYFRGLGLTLRTVRTPQQFARQVSDSSPARDDSLPAYRLTALRLPASGDTVVFRVDGLEDGIAYYWRIAVAQGSSFRPGSPSRIDAPTCPSRGKIGRG